MEGEDGVIDGLRGMIGLDWQDKERGRKWGGEGGGRSAEHVQLLEWNGKVSFIRCFRMKVYFSLGRIESRCFYPVIRCGMMCRYNREASSLS